jgi:myo-inositol-1(or 4)-monophosphatase
VRVRDCRQLSDARLLTTDPFLIKKHQDFAVFEELRRRVKICRSWGDGYGYLLLAAGCVDVMIDPVMHPWDIMALVPTVRGAGGTITDYHGGNPVKGTSILATAGTIHREVVEILNSKGG